MIEVTQQITTSARQCSTPQHITVTLTILANAAFITIPAGHTSYQRAWPQASRAATANRMKMNAGSAGSTCMLCVTIPIRALSGEACPRT
jgi:hypothetical protein